MILAIFSYFLFLFWYFIVLFVFLLFWCINHMCLKAFLISYKQTNITWDLFLSLLCFLLVLIRHHLKLMDYNRLMHSKWAKWPIFIFYITKKSVSLCLTTIDSDPKTFLGNKNDDVKHHLTKLSPTKSLLKLKH